jgi:hypothetical protein
MNIFVLDENPGLAAKYHNNKHCVKMCLEGLGLMSNAYRHFETEERCDSLGCFKMTHFNHPCSKWARENISNYSWLSSLTYNLFLEYTKRYNKVHACYNTFVIISAPPNGMNRTERTPFPQCMPDEYKNVDPVKAYRDYYMGEKRHLASWKTEVPWWWK